MKRLTIHFLAVALAALTALPFFTPIVQSAVRSKEASLCGGLNNTVEREFDISSAQSIWSYFPAMGRAPELSSDSRPAHVVVFGGNFDLAGLTHSLSDSAPVVTDAICVVQADGTPNLYDFVSRSGAKYP